MGISAEGPHSLTTAFWSEARHIYMNTSGVILWLSAKMCGVKLRPGSRVRDALWKFESACVGLPFHTLPTCQDRITTEEAGTSLTLVPVGNI